MNIAIAAVIVVIVIILFFVALRILKNCLPKILVGLLVLAGIAFLIYWFLIR